MGSRGVFEKSGMAGINEEFREYSVVDYIDGMKVIKWDGGNNNKSPVYSNTPNTVYYFYSTTNGRIEKIHYFKDHKLVRSVDMKKGELPHAHKWSAAGNAIGRKSHSKSNVFPLTTQDQKFYNLAKKWNDEHKRR